MKTDTIAAIATALSDSGIGIVRVSGADAFKVVDNIFRTKFGTRTLLKVKSHTIHYGFIVDEEESVLDEVMVMIMKAPNTYTREDTVEINCHGGVLMMKKILETVLKAGARIADPGEFTKRAFLNGRIDLSKAEAVIDIIHSKNELALSNSVKQLKGSISKSIRTLRELILYEISFIESALDDPEHISLEGYPESLRDKLIYIVDTIQNMIDSADNGKLIKEGINTVIVGKPNAGKSSFLNLLVGEERAIVTNIPGTTRDVLEEHIKLNGIGLNIIDTAGIRDTEDIVEKIGVEKAKEYIEQGDLILYVVDSSVPLDKNDEEIIQIIGDKKCIVLCNKIDLDAVVSEDMLPFNTIIKTSAVENVGIEELESSIEDMFFQGKITWNDDIIITNLRHKEALIDAKDSLQLVMKSIEDDMPEDFYSIDLMSAYASLGIIIGEEVDDDLVNEIFSKFCMGK